MRRDNESPVDRLASWIGRNTVRVITLLLAPGLLTLAFEVWVAHFAGKSGDHWAQPIPVYFGIAGGLVLLALALPRLPRKAFSAGIVGIGVVSLLIGLAGLAFHTLKLLSEIGDGPIDRDALVVALNGAPPTFAPMAFVGIGAILCVTGVRLLLVKIRLRRPR